MSQAEDDIAILRARVAELESMLRARERTITEMGYLLRGQELKPSRVKLYLVALWDRLPRRVQKNIEPFADFIDRVVK